MGWYVSDIICPNCGYEKAIEELHTSNEVKKIICKKCGFKKEFEAEIIWSENEFIE